MEFTTVHTIPVPVWVSIERFVTVATIIYTVAETAKLNGFDPEAYIAAVIDRLCRGHTIDRLSELLPWNFKLEKKTVATG